MNLRCLASHCLILGSIHIWRFRRLWTKKVTFGWIFKMLVLEDFLELETHIEIGIMSRRVLLISGLLFWQTVGLMMAQGTHLEWDNASTVSVCGIATPIVDLIRSLSRLSTQSVDYPDVGRSGPPNTVIRVSRDPGNQQYAPRHDSDFNMSFYSKESSRTSIFMILKIQPKPTDFFRNRHFWMLPNTKQWIYKLRSSTLCFRLSERTQ